jgi:hypothetical protein
MAKQTFTTGQVLTAAQMTSLQQTAMLGGDANARTASYVLVAGDAGNAVTMSSTSSTTITVNSGIFAAGDIVTIVNINSGVCTITAGTATVTTSGSLALSQNQGGILRFTSASAAIFLQFATPASGDIEGITTGANSGLTGGVTSGTADLKLNFTAKGQLAAGTGSGTTGFLTVGTNGQVLAANSSTSTGLEWQTATSGALTLITSTTISSSTSKSVDNCFSSSYQNYKIYIATSAAASQALVSLKLRASSTDASSNYKYIRLIANFNGVSVQEDALGTDEFFIGEASDTGVSGIEVTLYAPNETNETAIGSIFSGRNPTRGILNAFSGEHSTASAYTGFTLISDQNLTATIRVYGIANS